MGASTPGGGKSANYELNLVPFIDLFSSLICFLLMTAAWQGLEVVNTGAPPKSVDMQEDTEPPPPPPSKPKVMLTVTLYTDRIDVGEDNDVTSFRHLNAANPDYQKLIATLADWKKKYPERHDLVLATENRAPYKHLIQLMDIFKEGEFPEVGITLN
ncbi:MAG: biopolymer transporter ExbD [Bdellovibrionales bacterium]|jgi:biopolymer transport protein ExbD|nr:biopolymer transporter ExbD [Bdellovibrionales bacterium]